MKQTALRFAFTNTVWSQSSKSAAVYSLQIQDAGNLSCAFATFGKDVWLRRIIPQIWGTRLYLVGTHSLCPAIFSASSGCAAPPQSHIAPFCPQQSCCGLFCAFRASLPFSASVDLKFPHFKFTEVFMYYNTKASGARIRELRIAKNFTQDDLAEHMNVSRSFISLIESGRKAAQLMY